MTTTQGSMNTRISDLNKIIEHVEEVKKKLPGYVPNGPDPEAHFCEIATAHYLKQFDLEQISNTHLWFVTGELCHHLMNLAVDIGVEDLELFDPYLNNLPLMIVSCLAWNQGVDFEVDSLREFGSMNINQFFKNEQ